MSYQFSENIQRGILYHYKSNKSFHVEVNELIKPDYFEFPSHATLFNIIKDYKLKYNSLPNDEIILEEAKKRLSKNETLSDYQVELEFINSIDPTYRYAYIIDLVEEFAKKQKMKEAISASIPLLEKGDIEGINALVKDATLLSRNVDIGQEYYSALEDRYKRANDSAKNPKYKSLLSTVDKDLDGGLEKKELCMIVAPAGVGKTMYLINQAVVSMREGKNVLYLSFEMAEDKIAKRIDGVVTQLPSHVIKSDVLRAKEELKHFRGHHYGNLIIKEFLGGRESVLAIESYLMRLKNYNNYVPDVIIVDYLELLRPSRDCIPYMEQEIIARDLRTLAQAYNCVVYTATQTNREGKKVNVITDTELADSYGKTRPCDLIISLNQTTEEYDRGTMRAYVVKARDGKKGYIVNMNVDYKTCVMKEAKVAAKGNI